MSEEEGLYIAKELLNISEDIYLSYIRILNYHLSDNKEEYLKEKDKLSTLLKHEKKYYNKIDDDIILYILNELDDSQMITSIENNFDKYLNIINLGLKFNEVSYYRILCELRDKYIINCKLSRFDDLEIYDYELDEYNNRMLNNIILENQLFNDFLSLFIYNLNNYIKTSKDNKVKKDIITYKYICVFTYGNNNLDLLDKNQNNYIYSKYLYEMLLYADRDFSYNYDIIKTDYLDKISYLYFKNYKPTNNSIENIINNCFIKSIIMLYQEDYLRLNKIYNSVITVSDSNLDKLINNSANIVKQAKILTLNK